MPSNYGQILDPAKKGKAIKSAYDSETFDADGTIHVPGMVGSATISPCGRDVALASPEGLAIIDLDSPFSPPRRLSSHGLPWLVVDVQWSPFAAREFWVASTANHRCLVWNLNLREDSATGAIEHSLQGHSRAITDINFSAHHPDLLATCAVDGYVHNWDLRKPRQPVLTFCDWSAGATQVKYNRQDPNILASSHDRWLHIWDDRKPSIPLKSISAHTSKIYGLDWNRTESTSVVTCSLDKSIKFWDYAASDEPQRIIRTEFPVWRARHTPFGWGLLAMPQNDPGNLYLYDIRCREEEPVDNTVDPLAIFPGHGNHKVKEFLWRARDVVSDDGVDNRDFQLVSWGEDNYLRLHRVDLQILESVGHVKGGQARKIPMTRKGAAHKTYRAADDHANKEKRSATMSDPRPGSGGGHHRRSALTLGMQTMTPHYSRTSSATAWKGPSMKAKPTAAKGGDRSLDQLGWMKGITMSKKKLAAVGTPQRKESRDSTMFGPSFHDEHWGEPETLQEEIIRVNQQLPNVQWDNVDMDALTLKASLRGPWGTEGDTIYIKVKVDIPTNYPKSRSPKFLVEKTALMADDTYKKLDQEVNQLASQFSKKRQNCLEVAFSYLLGEIDLSSSDAFFKNVKDLDDDLGGLEDESSSDEEDNEIPPGGSATMSQELTASVELDATLAPINRPTIPPLPRLCGGRFSNDGKLVCFFPTKEEKAKALLFTPTESYKERPKGEPTFAGFGRLQQDSTPPRRRNMNDELSATDDHSESEASEDSSSSSDSETTYMHKINMWYLPGRRFRKTFSGTHSMHSSGGGTGIGTGTGTGTSRRRPARPKNVVSIYNLCDELPSKREFAHEYIIFGDGAAVCEHNADVAHKYGRHDLVDIWKYAALLLRKEIPLELFGNDEKRILVIAKDAVARFGDNGHAASRSADAPLTGRVKWGQHPLAKGLISDLFDHFERLADIQMLAMLSCIFSESSTEDSVAYAESHLTQPETPLPMKAPSFSLDYFPTDASLWHADSTMAKAQLDSAISTPKTLHTPVQVVGSYGSEEGAWAGEPESTSYSCGETPPTRTPKDHMSEGDPTQSLSTSPENRLLRRANTALTSSLASFPRPFATAASTSPPNRKHPSPGENFLANLAPSNITWGGSTILGPTSDPSAPTHNSYSDEESRPADAPPLVCYGISIEMADQTMFDDDGWSAVPFLEPSRTVTYANYRYAYAEMLQMWGQPLARLEIMKFNVLKDDVPGPQPGVKGFNDSYHSTENTSHASQSHLVLGKKEHLQSLITSGRGLDVTGICRVHETHLDPIRSMQAGATAGGAVGSCERSGDECDCVEEASSGQVETWAAMVGALRQGKVRKAFEEKEERSSRAKRGSIDKNDWENIATGANLPLADGQGKPLEQHQSQPPISAARISLGNRLRKSAGSWGSTASLRKKSGSVSSGLARR
ncbi:Uu.00g116480.m01.CDS01 [Anthostomella pinea]|uniref:Uu.00g116480.m01.CDS01 n=1 Tax=Anthostomella pinea TaxID=933095 RepID=A0AAI8VH39_9PEZI|nr:Uu.00g116480.m01.CDS01 [Anthostomella pinea]